MEDRELKTTQMELTQQNFSEFCKAQTEFAEALNHRMSRIEDDVKWMRRIGYYMATIITAMALKLIIFS